MIDKLNITVYPKQLAKSSDFNATTHKVDEIIDALNNGNLQIEVDDEFSDTSENPVQNKVITIELKNKIDSNKIEDIADIASLTLAKLTSIIPVIFPSDAEKVTVRLAVGGNIYNIGNIYQATLQSAGLMTPTMLGQLNKIEGIELDVASAIEKAENAKLRAIEYTDQKLSQVEISLDTEVSQFSTNAVQNKAIAEELFKRLTARDFTTASELLALRQEYLARITYDSLLSTISTNAPQTKVVKAAIDNTLTGAKTYADTKAENLKTYVDTSIQSAKDYTDAAINNISSTSSTTPTTPTTVVADASVVFYAGDADFYPTVTQSYAGDAKSGEVYYVSQLGTFWMKKGGAYYNAWSNVSKWVDTENDCPKEDVLYFNKDDRSLYVFDGDDLLPI